MVLALLGEDCEVVVNRVNEGGNTAAHLFANNILKPVTNAARAIAKLVRAGFNFSLRDARGQTALAGFAMRAGASSGFQPCDTGYRYDESTSALPFRDSRR
jgi:hypothetical protein